MPRLSLIPALLLALTACSAASARDEGVRLPAPTVDAAPAAGDATAVFAGGCFWGVEGVFQHVRGVKSVRTGYSGGDAAHANYDDVSDGDTGHAESVKVVYDPAQVSYGQLLQVFFSVAQDPTLLNRQGPDSGTQYRSAIFYATPEQKKVAEAYIAQLTAAHAFSSKIVTEVTPFKGFYLAEDEHQDYMRLNPDAMYIAINDRPKVLALQRIYPERYVAGWANGR
ncbi:MAG: peptide-methionine (S)-S-oxide reductase MsrA [Luteibacter sp.]|uniref:peptide-methionine (S)-S-oxide reductase MsrA n=1 Tax=Luteibacter TaxID=242605 RepID=UPI00068DDF49|nr:MULTISPECIES: peptide-methionine (S)-S-oxide reductase MsrA [unclassified Luteibacter]MDQ7997159.1 peptide-methionine (S)-S-oxide reductase MsrA [Luteibacter sp.]MDQ8049897.1 peptide-methionine (S)-S-oxide reductase MsrA [Luteibacter sp.]MDR6644536.1 peptide-methionine (S)-S-oxide reductase [Luteibacter sp. 1214]